MAAASGVGPEWVEYSSAAASTVGEFDADEFSMAEGTSEASGVQRLPDFKSMLEAALRGDVVRCTPESLASAAVQLSTVWNRVACHLCRGKPFMRMRCTSGPAAQSVETIFDRAIGADAEAQYKACRSVTASQVIGNLPVSGTEPPVLLKLQSFIRDGTLSRGTMVPAEATGEPEALGQWRAMQRSGQAWSPSQKGFFQVRFGQV